MSMSPFRCILVIALFIQIACGRRYYYGHDEFYRPTYFQMGCRYDGDRVPDLSTCGSFHKCTRSHYGTRAMIQSFCPHNQRFDVITRRCLGITCPKKASRQMPLPEGWKCSPNATGEYNVHPYDCTKYYKCVPCAYEFPEHYGHCYEKEETCPEGQFFDDTSKTCIISEICPHLLPALPKQDNLTCEAEGKMIAFPNDCSKYYKCIKCSKPGGWCYEQGSCEDGELFDNLKETCTPTEICPQDWIEVPSNSSGWKCSKPNESHDVPGNCSEFYTCHECKRPHKFCVSIGQCLPGMTYSDHIKSCLRSRCQQWPRILPANWTCENEMRKKQDPTDCNQFFTCVKCPDDPSAWCYQLEKCKAGHYFDEIQERCVKQRKCPKDDKPLPDGEGWKCDIEGDIHVVPNNCHSYYECYRCSKGSGWCYNQLRCPPGETFDDVLDTCVSGKCPQDQVELPNNWICELEGQMLLVPNNSTGNCTKPIYKCETCSKPGGWCYTC